MPDSCTGPSPEQKAESPSEEQNGQWTVKDTAFGIQLQSVFRIIGLFYAF